MGLPEPLVQVVISLNEDTTFFVQEANIQSNTLPQTRGVRQGCPLSPYLCIIFLSALMKDVYPHFSDTLPNTRVHDLEYADDTALLAGSTQTLQRYLHSLQDIALRYGMTLNPEKSQLVTVNSNQPVYFSFIVKRHPVLALSVAVQSSSLSRYSLPPPLDTSGRGSCLLVPLFLMLAIDFLRLLEPLRPYSISSATSIFPPKRSSRFTYKSSNPYSPTHRNPRFSQNRNSGNIIHSISAHFDKSSEPSPHTTTEYSLHRRSNAPTNSFPPKHTPTFPHCLPRPSPFCAGLNI